eukprot:TRINITY_DN224_c2_g1_i1.p1 TRINITY_DN224_c2_g1~~TRINITY_DN224_c2_g1_i1.p1  ORF type:complete len:1060 (+),score=419.98 TRINITY_DN224_c2_g1_i1:138-3182(+)
MDGEDGHASGGDSPAARGHGGRGRGRGRGGRDGGGGRSRGDRERQRGGESGGGDLRAQFSMLEPEMAELMVQEIEMMRRISQVSNRVAQKRRAKQAAYAKTRPERQKGEERLEELMELIEAKTAEKEEIYADLSVYTREGQKERSKLESLADHMEIIRLEKGSLQDDIARLKRERGVLSKRIAESGAEDLERNRKPIAALDREERETERRLELARQKQHTTVEQDLARKLNKLRSQRIENDDIARALGTVVGARVRLREVDKDLDQKMDDLTKLEQQLDECRQRRKEAIDARKEKQASTEEQSGRRRGELVKDLERVKGELDALHKERKEVIARSKTRRDEGEEAALRELLEEQRKLQEELDALRARIPTLTVDYDNDLFGATFREASTLREMERDYGCRVDLVLKENKARVRGGPQAQVEECARAIQELVAAARASRHERVMEYDPSTTAELLGVKGEHIKRLQTQSGAEVKVRSSEGKIYVVGTEEAVGMAESLLQEFKDAHAKDCLQVREEDHLLLRARWLKGLQEETQCKSIRFDPEGGVLVLIGPADCVAAARERVEKFLREMNEGSFTVRLPPSVSERAFIGARGANVRVIEEQTGTHVTVGAGHVYAQGPEASIAECRKLVDALIQDHVREEVRIPFPAPLYGLLVGDEWEEYEEDWHRGRGRRRPPCFLEVVRRESGCDSIKALYDESTVAVVGKREQVSAAKERIESFLVEHRLHTVELECDPIVARLLAQRLDGRSSTIAKARGIAGVQGISNKGDLVIVQGSMDGTDSARHMLRQEIERLERTMQTFSFDPDRIGAVFGKGGHGLQDIERRHNAVLQVDREANRVVIIGPDAAGSRQAADELEQYYSDNLARYRDREGDGGKGKGYRSQGPGEGRGKGKGKGEKGAKGRKDEAREERPERFRGFRDEDFPPPGAPNGPARPSPLPAGTVRAPPPPAAILERAHLPEARVPDAEWQRREREQRDRERRAAGGRAADGKGKGNAKGGERSLGGKGDSARKGGKGN